ncbi:hypothetical protein AB0N31_26210 [Streptomyces sp. NPDC051051]|uniref:hypothetical protein n=1 Tax=Streptomyces sp. NPDC051051 TaxID=3155666 RepID=UPI003415444A
MTAIDQLLARARLHPQPDVPDDTVSYEDTPYPADLPGAHPTPSPSLNPHQQAAARHLTTLCETALATVTEKSLTFLTDQMPDLHSAWLLGCALHIAGIPQGARFWWQYAAGDNHAPACYSLSLYHQSTGEQHAADFYRQQAHLLTAAPDTDTFTVVGTCPPQEISFDASLPTVLHTLHRLSATPGTRPRQRHRINALTNYVADTVTSHYTRHPGIEIPVPEPRFADRVVWLLTATLPWKRRTRQARPSEPGLPARRTTRSNYGQTPTTTTSCTSMI